jgi:hypothetical protein
MGLSSPMALNAAFLYEVTMFHPKRPCVIWSSVENRLASRNGTSEEVDEVIAKVRCFVTAAIAEMGCEVTSAGRRAPRLEKTYNRRISYGPLSRPANALVQLPLVGVVSSKGISQEQRVDSAPLEKLRQLNPVLQAALGGGFILRVLSTVRSVRPGSDQVRSYLPLPGGQVSHGAHIKRIQQNVLFAIPVSGSTTRAISHFD